MTVDGGLERLLQILHEFCMCPPPPENPAIMYGLSPPGSHPPKLAPTLNPPTYDKHAAYRFSIAFQCVVNIGVRGSEPIRSRVVQAGALNVVGCILEAWLANRGFAVGPRAYSAANMRESKEQRHARRVARDQEQRQREEAAELDRALQRSIRINQRRIVAEDESLTPSSDGTSTENSTATTPVGENTPTPTIVVSARERSGTIIARPARDRQRASPSPDTDTSSRPETETEDDNDVDMDRSMVHTRPVAIVSDEQGTASIQVTTDDPIIINDAEGGVENGIVSLETANDDFAMGAPPGAPGAIQETTATGPRTRRAADATPRAGLVTLPMVPDRTVTGTHHRTDTIRAPRNIAIADTTAPSRSSHHHHHHRDAYSGPYRDEDVLLALQLLAYLSKYPHVRQAFYKPCLTFHPASAFHPGVPSNSSSSAASTSSITKGKGPASFIPEPVGFAKAFFVKKDKDKEKPAPAPANTSSSSTLPEAPRQTNIFSLVERFTFRPSSSDVTDQPRLPSEIRYWAGVIMRNACRKDESRGGIRQCANMLCGKWESYPREFAKCRRCRKAKYCGKECQSTAWNEGHRFWCSAKETEEDGSGQGSSSTQTAQAQEAPTSASS